MAIDGKERSSSEFGQHDLFINVLGASFSITVGENPDYLNEVLEQYHMAVTNTQAISGMKDPLKVAILTGFLLCDEINKLRLQVEEEHMAAESALNHTADLVLNLDKVIGRTRSDNG
jgi:cell division protein ZapA (FtsZ GTPase activity inhibitor)